VLDLGLQKSSSATLAEPLPGRIGVAMWGWPTAGWYPGRGVVSRAKSGQEFRYGYCRIETGISFFKKMTPRNVAAASFATLSIYL
jgi:hypothetical protein